MTKAEFRDALCVLRSIDCWELEEAGVFDNIERRDSVWPEFRDDPFRTFILLPEKMAEKVWSIIERQMRRSVPSASPAAGDAGQKALPAAELIAGQTALPDDAS